MIWVPLIVIVALSVAPLDLSSLLAPRGFARKSDCEQAVAAAVKAMRALYPTLQIKSAGCVLDGKAMVPPVRMANAVERSLVIV